MLSEDKFLADKKARYWGEERNARRRELYRTNKDYRDIARQHTRETYRKIRERDGATVRNDDCSKNILLLDSIGEYRTVVGTEISVLTLTVEEMARALNRNQQVLYRWFASDMLPRPVINVETRGKRTQLVYTEREAIAILSAFAKHQKHSQYYRERHEETRGDINFSVAAVRGLENIS